MAEYAVTDLAATLCGCVFNGASLPIMIVDLMINADETQINPETDTYRVTAALYPKLREFWSLFPTLANFNVRSNTAPVLATLAAIGTPSTPAGYTAGYHTTTTARGKLRLYYTPNYFIQGYVSGPIPGNDNNVYYAPFFLMRVNGNNNVMLGSPNQEFMSYLTSAIVNYAQTGLSYDSGFYYGIAPVSYYSDSVRDIAFTFGGFWTLNTSIITPRAVPSEDPYSGGGISGPGGGDGDFDFTSTDIPIPALPNIGAYNTGFISLYRPSATELASLANYMWSGAFDPDNFKKLFADPMDCILGLHIIPTSGAHPAGASSTLQVGNISTGLNMQRLTEQYYELDCGTINISPKWGAYLDYSPYSKLSLFLPYIGFVPLSPDDCMGGTIRVVYHVDVLSGSCCAFVYCTSNRGADGHTLYTFTGSCACDCPVTEGQYTNALFGSLRVAGGIIGAAMSGTQGIMSGLENAASAALSMVKPDIGRSGSFGGSAGLMGIQYPYLVLMVPRMATPEDQNKYIGYPSFVTTELSTVTGYASIEITHLEGMSATDEEISELVGLLKEGVIM